jgi:hypothetical protein
MDHIEYILRKKAGAIDTLLKVDDALGPVVQGGSGTGVGHITETMEELYHRLLLKKHLKDEQAPPEHQEKKAFDPGALASSIAKRFHGISTPGLAGAGLGALHGGVGGYLDARNRGESLKDSLQGGLSRAAVEGAVGGVVGGGAHLYDPNTGAKITRFRDQIRHSITGWTPEGGVQALQGGSAALKNTLDTLGPNADPETIKTITKQMAAMRAAEDKGLTSIPGLAKGLFTPSRTVDTLRTAKNVLLDGTPGYAKALMGVGAVAGALPALQEGLTPQERLYRAVQPAASMLATAPLGVTPAASGFVSGLVSGNFSSLAPRLADYPLNELRRAAGERHNSRVTPAVTRLAVSSSRPYNPNNDLLANTTVNYPAGDL